MDFVITRWKAKVLGVTAAFAAAAFTCGTLTTSKDERCFFLVCDIICAIAQQYAGEGVPKLNTLPLHLCTTAEGKRHADGENQREGVFHGRRVLESNRTACKAGRWRRFRQSEKSQMKKGRKDCLSALR